MRQTELKLSARDRAIVEEVRHKGVHRAREVNRAHVLGAWTLACRRPRSWPCWVSVAPHCGALARPTCKAGSIWPCSTLPALGAPREYDTAVEAQVSALACSTPPAGHKRWSVVELERAAQRESGLARLSRETVRRMLKKTTSSPGAG